MRAVVAVAVAQTRIRDQDRGYRALKQRLFGPSKTKVAVGILTGDGGHAEDSHKGDEKGAALTLLEVAIENEFGGPNGNDPPERSFIRDWFDGVEPRKREELITLMQAVIKGRYTREQILELMGQRCVGEIQERIAQHIPPPNAPATIRQKGSSTPLIRYGQLRAGLTYAVRRKDEPTG